MRYFRFILAIPLMVLSACSTDITAPAPNAIRALEGSYATSNATSQWEEWQTNWYSVCDGKSYTGTARIHFVRRFVTDETGSYEFYENLNVAGVKLVNEDGDIAIYTDIRKTNTSYEVSAGLTRIQQLATFRLILRGGTVLQMDNLKFEIVLGPGGVISFYSEYDTICR